MITTTKMITQITDKEITYSVKFNDQVVEVPMKEHSINTIIL